MNCRLNVTKNYVEKRSFKKSLTKKPKNSEHYFGTIKKRLTEPRLS